MLGYLNTNIAPNIAIYIKINEFEVRVLPIGHINFKDGVNHLLVDHSCIYVQLLRRACELGPFTDSCTVHKDLLAVIRFRV
jgi:hypothetical protein